MIRTHFSKAMLQSIECQIELCRRNSGVLDVYQASERVRRENLSDNVAHEDIVIHFAENIGSRCNMEFLAASAMKVANSKSRGLPQKRLLLTNGNAK